MLVHYVTFYQKAPLSPPTSSSSPYPQASCHIPYQNHFGSSICNLTFQNSIKEANDS